MLRLRLLSRSLRRKPHTWLSIRLCIQHSWPAPHVTHGIDKGGGDGHEHVRPLARNVDMQPHANVLNGTVKWYNTLVLTIWFVSAYEYAGNGSRYKV